jgi:hypothetical protein
MRWSCQGICLKKSTALTDYSGAWEAVPSTLPTSKRAEQLAPQKGASAQAVGAQRDGRASKLADLLIH